MGLNLSSQWDEAVKQTWPMYVDYEKQLFLTHDTTTW